MTTHDELIMPVRAFSPHATPFIRSFRVFVAFLGLAVYALGANPFAGETIAPFDLLLAQPGWSSVHADVQVSNFGPHDILDANLPLWITLKEQIRTGKGVLWYPHGAGGQPVSFEVWNPAFLLFLAIPNTAWALYLVALFKLVVSGTGVYLLLRTFLPPLPAVWGGFVFMLCGFNAAWFYWDQVTTAMWIPWLLWAIVQYLATDDRRRLLLIVVSSLLLILGGFPSVGAYGFYASGVLVIAWILDEALGKHELPTAQHDARSRKQLLVRSLLPFAAITIAFLLAAIALVPFLDALSGINLEYRQGSGTFFEGGKDLMQLISYEPQETLVRIERSAFVGAPVVLLALIGLIPLIRSADRQFKRFIAIHAFLAVVSLTIAFGLLPDWVIWAIPTFHFNPWNRAVVITLLCLAVLSAVGLDVAMSGTAIFLKRFQKLPARYAQGIILFLALIAGAYQFHTQKTQFDLLKAVVPASWIYPDTPSIRYVRERLTPLQSVIADGSFLSSGTLGAYGIPEWYAHSFRTDREKVVLSELVRDPFVQMTGAIVEGENIRFQSPLIDRLMVRYVLASKSLIEKKETLSLTEYSPVLAPPLPGNAWKQHLHVREDRVVGAFGFRFSTFGKGRAPANVTVSLYDAKGSRYPIQAEIDKNAVVDNAWVLAEFAQRLHLKKGDYVLEVSLVDYHGPDKLSVWATTGYGNDKNYLAVNEQKTDMALNLRIEVFEKVNPGIFGDQWRVIDLEKDIMVLENTRVTNSAYFIQDRSAPTGRIDFTGLDVKRPSAELLEIRYTNNKTGWVVLPMHLHPGWKASIDDRPVDYDTYLDILPAIPVNGACRITFKYQPASFRWGAAISVTGCLFFLIFRGYCRRGRGQA